MGGACADAGSRGGEFDRRAHSAPPPSPPPRVQKPSQTVDILEVKIYLCCAKCIKKYNPLFSI